MRESGRLNRLSSTAVCIFGMNYPPEPTGIAPYTGALAVGLSESGHAVTAHVAHPHYPEWRISSGYGQWSHSEQLDGVHVRRRRHYVPASPRGSRRLLSELSFGVRSVLSAWGRPAVIIAVSPSLFSTALTALRVRFTPRRPAFIVWVQDIYTLGLAETGEGGGLVRRLTQWVEGRTLRAADRVVVIHQRFAEFVSSEHKVAESRIAVLRNWTHLPPSAPVDAASAKSALGWPHDGTLVVHAGNMGAKQGLENVVDAARVADERGAAIHFILVGDGGERRMLEQRAHGVARLTFVDPLGDEEFRLALGAADVLLVNEKPGVSAMAVPSKLTSYFDAGRPVIAATDSEGTTAAEIEAAGAGLIVPAGDPDALVNAIGALASDADGAARFGQNGRRYRELVLDEHAAIDQWIATVSDVLAVSRRRPEGGWRVCGHHEVNRRGRFVLLSSSAIRKRINILTRPYFARAAITHRVAAATEHQEAIRLSGANTLLDAGANKGQFSLVFRRTRPTGRIIAFEPLPEAAEIFDRLFAGDRLTTLQRVALAGTEGTAQFFVADRTDSSSLLRPGHGEERAFGVRPATTMSVPVRRLDTCVDLGALVGPVMLKVDVQGGELGVFDGMAELDLVDFIYVELSFVELYERQPLFHEVTDYLTSRGFVVMGFFNQVSTGEFGPTQVDVLFRNGRHT